MLKKYLAPLAITQLALVTSTFATPLPSELMYSGKPIDSLCFSIQEDNIKTIDLRDCGAEKEKYVVKGQNDELNKKGYIGYDWTAEDSSYSGYSYYKFYDAGNKLYWVYTLNNGGGTGQFTSIYLVQRTNTNTLSIQAVTGGDRCNGGVQDVSAKDQTLTFSVNLTAYDLMALASSKLTEVKAYDDLAACAACCVAKAVYSVNTSLKPELTYVDLGEKSPENEMPDQGTLQKCFNQLFTNYSASGEKLDPKQLNEFSDRFIKTCLPQKK